MMKKILAFLRDFLPHLLLALSVVLLSFFILDRFNRAMNFINNDHTKRLLLIFGQLAAAQAVLLASEYARRAGKTALIGCVAGVLGGLGSEVFVFLALTDYLTYEESKWSLAATIVLTVAASVVHIILRRKESVQAPEKTGGDPAKAEISVFDGMAKKEIK